MAVVRRAGLEVLWNQAMGDSRSAFSAGLTLVCKSVLDDVPASRGRDTGTATSLRTPAERPLRHSHSRSSPSPGISAFKFSNTSSLRQLRLVPPRQSHCHPLPRPLGQPPRCWHASNLASPSPSQRLPRGSRRRLYHSSD